MLQAVILCLVNSAMTGINKIYPTSLITELDTECENRNRQLSCLITEHNKIAKMGNSTKADVGNNHYAGMVKKEGL